MEQNTRNETKQEPNEENLLFNIIDEGKIAYVKINTFML
jgi:hypothetical protein